MSESQTRIQKLCFVTIGATAAFDDLINATLDTRFLGTLRSAGYTNLRLQYGHGGKKILDNFLDTQRHENGVVDGIAISGFDFKSKGLTTDMSEARGDPDHGIEGVVISHAGENVHSLSQ